jgi:hypothetical protein
MAAPSEYLRARRDSAFRERVARGYSGDFVVLDALWWREHPGSPTPEGVAPPTAGRAELQRAAFARAATGGADAVPRADRAAAELARLDETSARERLAIDSAVAAALAEGTDAATEAARSAAVGTVAAGPAGADRAAAGPAGADAAAHPGTPRSRWPWWPRRRLLVAAGAAFAIALVGGAVGFGLSETSNSNVAGLGPEDGPPFADASAALAIFDRPPQPSDRPPVLYAIQLQEETVRTLSMADIPLYVARDIDDDVCLVLVQTNGTYTANCVPPDRFPSTGLLIRGSIAVTGRPSQGDQLPQSFVDVEASWLPDGTTVWGQNPQTR